MHQEIRLVLFDGDDTLWDERADMRAGLEMVTRELEPMVGPAFREAVSVESLAAVRTQILNMPEWKARHLSTQDLEEVRRLSFVLVAHQCGVDPHRVPALMEKYLATRWGRRTPFPDVRPTLQELAANYALGVVSNGRSIPGSDGLSQFFQIVVRSQDVGHEKPHPAIFLEALQRAKTPPAAAVFVGDDPVADIDGAKRVGMKAVLVDRSGSYTGDGGSADAVVSRLTSVPAWIDAWSRKDGRRAE